MNEHREAEKVNQVISLKVTESEKKALDKYCRNVRLSKSSAIRDFIRRGTGMIPIQKKIEDLKPEEFKETLSPVILDLYRRIEALESKSARVKPDKKESDRKEDENTIEVPFNRLADKHLNKKEIAILAGISLSTLSNIKRYTTESGEQLFKPLGKINNVGYYDCSEIHPDNIPDRFQMNIDWGRLVSK